ncbi:MAG: hypothetical protein JWN00_3788 [Actinomycetia bacterium]|nr:hypothetical protein [Actinomycetes bacterium]
MVNDRARLPRFERKTNPRQPRLLGSLGEFDRLISKVESVAGSIPALEKGAAREALREALELPQTHREMYEAVTAELGLAKETMRAGFARITSLQAECETLEEEIRQIFSQAFGGHAGGQQPDTAAAGHLPHQTGLDREARQRLVR